MSTLTINLTANKNDIERKPCPYKEKCYRKNPIHFSEMSHPHLEKLIRNQLNGPINLPDKLDFECSDRSQLSDQLKVLQIVLRKHQGIIGEENANPCVTPTKDFEPKKEFDNKVAVPKKQNAKKTPAKSPKITPKKEPKQKTNEESLSFKDKVERNKQTALERRQQKLKEMDDKQMNLGKRPLADLETSASAKKIKCEPSNKVSDSDSPRAGSSSSESSSGKSTIADAFTSCKDMSRRKELRDRAISQMIQNGIEVPTIQPGEFDIKFALSAPYHYFLTRVKDCKETHNQPFTVSLHELLDESLGEIVDSLHINFMIQIGWLCSEYLLAAQSAKMTIVYGSIVDPQLPLPSSIKAMQVKMPTEYGCHHSKISILKYKDNGIRIIISTANLYSDDWENRTQGLWMSPHLPQLSESANPSDGDSSTGFKKDFRQYLAAYRHPYLLEWEGIIKRADFSAVNVFFVASVPGSHKGINLNNWGHRKLSLILSKYAVLPPDGPQWTIIAQSSSIGNLGPSFESWLSTDIVNSMSREKAMGIKSNPNFQFIYPSVKNYMQSFDSLVGSSCLPYSRQQHVKQEWLKNYLYQWKSDNLKRTKAIPHIKSYTRISPDRSKIPWFVLTSANLSKGAWGSTAKNGTSHYLMNYEAGVVFIPQIVIGQDVFPIKESVDSSVPTFRIPYDLPLTRYCENDEPFVNEVLRGSYS